MSSFVSANGPSMTVRSVPENRTRLPLELGWRPSPASMTPAFTSSSLYFPMSVSNFSVGICPASDSLLAFTITITRIVTSCPFYVLVERGTRKSTWLADERQYDKPARLAVLDGQKRLTIAGVLRNHP